MHCKGQLSVLPRWWQPNHATSLPCCSTPNQVSAPERVGGYEYYVQQLPSAPHPCYMRRAVGRPRAVPEVVLDLNELAAVHGEYVQVGQASGELPWAVQHSTPAGWAGGRWAACMCEAVTLLPAVPPPLLQHSLPTRPAICAALATQMKLSQCGQHVAFTLEEGQGEESWAAFTRDLGTGAMRHLSALGTVVSLEWAADGDTLLCTQPNELGRPWRVLTCSAAAAAGEGRRRAGGQALGSGSGGGGGGGSRVVFEEGDERFFVELGRTKDWR